MSAKKLDEWKIGIKKLWFYLAIWFDATRLQPQLESILKFLDSQDPKQTDLRQTLDFIQAYWLQSFKYERENIFIFLGIRASTPKLLIADSSQSLRNPPFKIQNRKLWSAM